MGAIEDVTEVLELLDTATNEVADNTELTATRLQKLIDELAGAPGGLTAADVQNVLARLRTEQTQSRQSADRLRVLASDPANPVPPVVEPPVPPVEIPPIGG